MGEGVGWKGEGGGVFDFHLPFLISQVLFYQTKFPFYWGEESFSKNDLIKFFHFRK